MTDPSVSRDERHVLVVEDDDDVRGTLEMLFVELGCRVETAASGEQAVALAMRTSFDIAFIDIGLPGIDGHEVARRLRERAGKAIVLVALTGLSGPDERARSRSSGFDHHLIKPPDYEDLVGVLCDIG